METRILIVEDDADLGQLLSRYLEVKGFAVRLVTDGRLALAELAASPFAIAVLDVMLPGKDGFAVAAELTQRYPELPFLFLTARRQQADVLRGLGLGADDYMVKPFDADELVLRVKNILKRSTVAAPPPSSYAIGRYRFEPAELHLILEDQRIPLTPKEAALLEMLCHQPGRLVKRKDILETIWGSADFFNGRSLDVFIRRLRKLLAGDPAVAIEVVRSAGFVLHI